MQVCPSQTPQGLCNTISCTCLLFGRFSFLHWRSVIALVQIELECHLSARLHLMDSLTDNCLRIYIPAFTLSCNICLVLGFDDYNPE